MSTKPPSSEKDAPEDFWDLGDDLDVNLPAPQEAPKSGAIEELPEPEEVSNRSPESAQARETREEDLPTSGADPGENDGVLRSPAGSIGQWVKTFSLIEKVSILIVIACLAGAAVWGISSYLHEAPQGELITFDEDFPVKGEKITAAEVETWWRRPIRSGANVDRGVVIEANLIPCARIKLQDSGSTTLQVTFRDGKRDLVGDPITLTVEGGKFTSTNSDEIFINSTSGFPSTSDLNAYTNGDIDPWSIVIEESDGSSNDSEPLLRVRIDPIYKED